MEKPNTGETMGVLRKLDDLGRITLPVDHRKELGITTQSKLEIFYLKDGFYIRKVER